MEEIKELIFNSDVSFIFKKVYSALGINKILAS